MRVEAGRRRGPAHERGAAAGEPDRLRPSFHHGGADHRVLDAHALAQAHGLGEVTRRDLDLGAAVAQNVDHKAPARGRAASW